MQEMEQAMIAQSNEKMENTMQKVAEKATPEVASKMMGAMAQQQ